MAAAVLPYEATEAAGRQRFDIPGGRLGDALVALGRQGSVNIGVSDPALANERVRRLTGTHTVQEALRLLLRGTDGRYVAIDSITFQVVRRAPTTSARQVTRKPRTTRTSSPVTPPGAGVPEDIVVIAAKRPIRSAVFPGSADILEGDDHTPDGGLHGSDALVARLPTLTSTHLGPGRNKLFIRGIADLSFSGPTQSTVGQYLGEARLTYNAPDPDLRLVDFDRIEILSGPQGTLYGTGSLGGIIRLVPNAPRLDTVEASLSAGAANTWHGAPGAESAGVLNLPIVQDQAAIRLVAYGSSEGGYIDDLQRDLDDVNRTEILGGRAALRSDIGGGWLVDVGLTGQRIRGKDAQSADRDAPNLTRRSAVRQDYSNGYLLGDVVVSREWNDLRLVSAVGVVRQELDERFDATRLDAPMVFDQESDFNLLSFETRLSHQKAGGAGDWLAGVSFVRNRSEQLREFGDPEAPQPQPGVVNLVTEGALFGQATIQLGGGVSGTGGGRLVYSRLSGSVPGVPPESSAAMEAAAAKRSSATFLPSFSLSASPASGLFLFLRYEESFRPGGIGLVGSAVRRFDRDSLATVEAGARLTPPGGNIDASILLAFTRWHDIQAAIIDISSQVITANIGDGRIFTIDAKLDWKLTGNVTLEAAAIINDSLVTDPRELSIGNSEHKGPLPNVARVNGRFSATYEAEVPGLGELQLSAAARYVGRSRLGIAGVLAREQGDWFDLSVGARLESGGHRFSLGVSNLFDNVGNRFAFGSPYLLWQAGQITPLRPRTLRIGWQVRF